MATCKVIFFVLLFLAELVRAETLLDLENQRLENDKKLSEVFTQIEKANFEIQKIEKAKSIAIQSLLENIKTIKSLKSYSWGRWLSLKDPLRLDNKIFLMKKINEKTLAQIQEYGLLNDAYKQQKQILNSQKNKLETLNQTLLKQELAIKVQEQKDLTAAKTNFEHTLLELKGLLSSPVNLTQAKIKVSFGHQNLPKEFQANYFVKGLEFSTDSPQPIYAVGPGVVIFRDEIPHWGESVIIRHDGLYYSVYASLQGATVSVGDHVNQSELIALTNHNHLYFELRHSSVALNPQFWIKDLK